MMSDSKKGIIIAALMAGTALIVVALISIFPMLNRRTGNGTSDNGLKDQWETSSTTLIKHRSNKQVKSGLPYHY